MLSSLQHGCPDLWTHAQGYFSGILGRGVALFFSQNVTAVPVSHAAIDCLFVCLPDGTVKWAP